jgi:uncharacterized RDD family membrane protein YckC
MNESSLIDTESEFDIESTKPAGFWIRLGAYLIDMLIIFAVGIGAVFVKSPVIYVTIVVLLTLYKPVLESNLGGTAGKLALGLRVGGVDGHKLSLVSAIVRSGIFILPVIPSTMIQLKLLEAGIGPFDVEAQQAFKGQNEALYIANYALSVLTIVSCIVVAFNQRKRGLHDMMADSFVIYENKANS